MAVRSLCLSQKPVFESAATAGVLALALAVGLGAGPAAASETVRVTDATPPAATNIAQARECAAALSLMREVAPKWSAQPGFDAAEAGWRRAAGPQVDLSADKARHYEGMVADPRTLSRLAMVCLVDAPAAG